MSFSDLIKTHPVFHYHSYQVLPKNNSLEIEYDFEIESLGHFRPNIKFNLPSDSSPLVAEQLCALAFQFGLFEIISYWKLTCSPKIQIHCGVLSDLEIQFFKKLFYLGLGEFRFVNEIESDQSWVDFECDEEYEPDIETKHHCVNENRVLVPIGGGKDSACVIELLKGSSFEIFTLMLNEDEASREIIQLAGVSESHQVFIERVIDPKLIECNNKGFLNGHVPFSAILGMLSIIAASSLSIKYVVLGNEFSANEGNVVYKDKEINHQYSKSLEFEKDFQKYLSDHISTSIQYFSLLRPLHELEIAKYFATLKKYHSVFRSCNKGKSKNEWCGQCSKCLFVWCILSPWLSRADLVSIFQTDLFSDLTLAGLLRELCGYAVKKPLDCVGTFYETKYSLGLVMSKENFTGGGILSVDLIDRLRNEALLKEPFKTCLGDRAFMSMPEIFYELLMKYEYQFKIH